MANERVIANDSTADVPTFGIRIGDNRQDVNPGYQIMAVSVTKEVNRIPTARIVIRDGESASETFEISNAGDFAPGEKIEIEAGADGDDELIFKGIVTKQSIRVGQDGNAFLTVECKDESIKMTAGRKNKYFENKKDSDVIGDILSAYGLKGSIASTTVTHPELVQHHATDWDFVVMRAEMNGLLIIASDGVVDVVRPGTSGSAVQNLIFGATMFEFDAELDSRYQWKKVESKAWDHANQQLLNAVSNSATFEEGGNISGQSLAEVLKLESFDLRHSAPISQEELKAWSDACMLKSRMAKIRGRVKSLGLAKLKPGVVIELQGVGDRFNGKAYVTAIRHELIEGSWYTDSQFGLQPEWFHQRPDIMDCPAGGMLPAVSGLQIGVVTKMHEDPAGEHRVQVKMPTLDPEGKGVWARVASLDAGNNRGAYFRPELDDEVVLGFVNGDPREPVIVGMLNSSSRRAPITADQENTEKGFVTRSEMKLVFDDVKKVITILTPAGNSIIISEDSQSIEIVDQHGNEIKTNSSGIALTSPSDIKIEATGNVNITATTGDVNIEGLNVNVTGSLAAKLEGTGSAEVTSGGVTTIGGSMVSLG